MVFRKSAPWVATWGGKSVHEAHQSSVQYVSSCEVRKELQYDYLNYLTETLGNGVKLMGPIQGWCVGSGFLHPRFDALIWFAEEMPCHVKSPNSRHISRTICSCTVAWHWLKDGLVLDATACPWEKRARGKKAEPTDDTSTGHWKTTLSCSSSRTWVASRANNIWFPAVLERTNAPQSYFSKSLTIRSHGGSPWNFQEKQCWQHKCKYYIYMHIYVWINTE